MLGVRAARGLALAGVLASGVGLVGASVAGAQTDGGRGPAPVGVSVTPSVHASASVPVRVEASALRVRGGPNLHGVVLGLLARGDKVRVVERGPVSGGYRWEEVRTSGRSGFGLRSGVTGWVAARYVATPRCSGGWVPWVCS